MCMSGSVGESRQICETMEKVQKEPFSKERLAKSPYLKPLQRVSNYRSVPNPDPAGSAKWPII